MDEEKMLEKLHPGSSHGPPDEQELEEFTSSEDEDPEEEDEEEMTEEEQEYVNNLNNQLDQISGLMDDIEQKNDGLQAKLRQLLDLMTREERLEASTEQMNLEDEEECKDMEKS